MIDKVLGFDQPAPNRRRKADNASQSSSKIETSAVSTASPAKPLIRKLNTQEIAQPPQKGDDGEEGPIIVQSVHRSKPKPNTSRSQTTRQQTREVKNSEQTLRTETKPKRNQSQEEIASPQVRNLKIAQMQRSSKAIEEMKNSGKFRMRQSATGHEFYAVSDGYETSYKLKMLAVLIIGLLLTIYAMTPARKAPARRR